MIGFIERKPAATGAVTGTYSGFGFYSMFGDVGAGIIQALQVGTTVVSFLIAIVSLYVLVRKHFNFFKEFPFVKFDKNSVKAKK